MPSPVAETTVWTRILRFVVVGVSNTAISLAVIFALWKFAAWSDGAANAAGYVIGFAWSFVMNRRWTFSSEESVVRSFPRFALVCAVAYLANVAILAVARQALGPDTFLPHAFGMAVYTVVGFLGSQRFAFRTSMRNIESD